MVGVCEVAMPPTIVAIAVDSLAAGAPENSSLPAMPGRIRSGNRTAPLEGVGPCAASGTRASPSSRRRAGLQLTPVNQPASFAGPPAGAARTGPLRKVLGDRRGHLEHGNLILADDSAKLVVGIDHALVVLVLQVVRLDVFPHLGRDLGAAERALAAH